MIDRTKIDEPWITANPMTYNVLKEKAKERKKFLTEAERYMWVHLRGKALGVRFREQYIIDNYIVDFVCLSHNLVIEIDGGYHNAPEQQKEDQIRTHRLQELGFTELRFTNEEVLQNIDIVIKRIQDAIR